VLVRGEAGSWIPERVRVLQRALARLEGRRREALARDDTRMVAWAEDLIVRHEALLAQLELRNQARPSAPPDGHGVTEENPGR